MKKVSKEQEVALLLDKFSKAKGMVFTGFRGLTAPEMVALRGELARNGLEYRVVKNTLAAIAAKQVGIQIEGFLEGPSGILFGYADAVLPFRLALALSKKYERYKLKGGLMDGRAIGAEEVKQLALLPSREDLLRQLAGAMQAPISRWLWCLKAPMNQLAVLLTQLQKKNQKEGLE